MNQEMNLRSEDRADYTATAATATTDADNEVIANAIAILDARMRRSDADPIKCPEDMFRFLRLNMSGLEREEMRVVWLDTRHHMLGVDLVAIGTIDGATVHPREIVKAGLRRNAAAAILAHNHPSGNPEPSTADRLITRKVQEALAMVDIRMLDHIVVGGLSVVSLAARGWV